MDPGQVFNIVEDLNWYTASAANQSMRDNPTESGPAAGLRGEGRILVVYTDRVHESGISIAFDLAELVLSENFSKLTFAIHKFKKVAIPSEELHNIAEKYLKE